MTVSTHSIWGSFKRTLLAATFSVMGLMVAPVALAVDPVSEIRVVSSVPDLVVGQVYGLDFEFYDDSGARIPLAPNQTIDLAPAGVFPCDVAECSNTDYTETVPTEAGLTTYRVYVRSLVAGINFLTITHPNGTRLQFPFDAVDGVVTTPPPSGGVATSFSIVNRPTSLAVGDCAPVQVAFQTDAGTPAVLPEAIDVLLSPGGGFHPSFVGDCSVYQNDPVSIPAGSSEFTFYGYVVDG